jgi:hypothetical protein
VRAAALALVAAAALAGCGGSEKPPPHRSDRALIAGWLHALNAHDYGRAAGYFARDAIVDQGRPLALPDREAAIAFNRSLPCKGRLKSVRDEGRTSLGTFALVSGSGGPSANCDGSARVRFTIKGGRFTVWRQLPEPPPPRGTEA